MVMINPDDFLKHAHSSIEITEVFFNREVPGVITCFSCQEINTVAAFKYFSLIYPALI